MVLPYRRQRVREGEHVLVFGALPDVPKSLVVAVLLAALGVAAGCLNVSVRLRADPDIAIGGRDRQLADPRQRRVVVDLAPVGRHIGEASARFPAPDARRIVAHIAETGCLGGVPGVHHIRDGSVLFLQHENPG